MSSITKYISETISAAAFIPGVIEATMKASKGLMNAETTRLCNQGIKARNWAIRGSVITAVALGSICLLTIAALGALVWPLIPTYSFAACCISAAIGITTTVSSAKKYLANSKQLAKMAEAAMPAITGALSQDGSRP